MNIQQRVKKESLIRELNISKKTEFVHVLKIKTNFCFFRHIYKYRESTIYKTKSSLVLKKTSVFDLHWLILT